MPTRYALMLGISSVMKTPEGKLAKVVLLLTAAVPASTLKIIWGEAALSTQATSEEKAISVMAWHRSANEVEASGEILKKRPATVSRHDLKSVVK